MAAEIRTRMEKTAKDKPVINMYNTRDNAERLVRATSRKP
jgi:GST-like protein